MGARALCFFSIVFFALLLITDWSSAGPVRIANRARLKAWKFKTFNGLTHDPHFQALERLPSGAIGQRKMLLGKVTQGDPYYRQKVKFQKTFEASLRNGDEGYYGLRGMAPREASGYFGVEAGRVRGSFSGDTDSSLGMLVSASEWRSNPERALRMTGRYGSQGATLEEAAHILGVEKIGRGQFPETLFSSLGLGQPRGVLAVFGFEKAPFPYFGSAVGGGVIEVPATLADNMLGMSLLNSGFDEAFSAGRMLEGDFSIYLNHGIRPSAGTLEEFMLRARGRFP